MVGDHGSENQVIVKGHLLSSSVDVGMVTLKAMVISKVLCVCVFSHAS